MPIRFSDRVVLKTEGDLRKHQLFDGWYILGEGMSLPCEDEAQADRVLAYLKERRRLKNGADSNS